MNEPRLDGNAAAGALGEVFSFEATTAEYACLSCDNVLIRLAHNRDRLWMARCCFRSGFGGLR
jgi:hypothetical protein